MTALSQMFPAAGGMRLLDRRVFLASATWTKPAENAGNIAAGKGKIVSVTCVGGGGGGNGAGATDGGDTTFGGHLKAGGGKFGQAAFPGSRGGIGTVARGENGAQSGIAFPGGGWGGIAGVPDNAGAGGIGATNGQGGGGGGLSRADFDINTLGATVPATVGSGGASINTGVGLAGYIVVETWG